MGKAVQEKEVVTESASTAAAKSLQLCPTLCDPMNRSMPGLPVHHQIHILFPTGHLNRTGSETKSVWLQLTNPPTNDSYVSNIPW